jgi:hypothetical protein
MTIERSSRKVTLRGVHHSVIKDSFFMTIERSFIKCPWRNPKGEGRGMCPNSARPGSEGPHVGAVPHRRYYEMRCREGVMCAYGGPKDPQTVHGRGPKDPM